MNDRDGDSPNIGDPADARLSRLYRAGAQEEPPPRVDAAVSAAARREVGARPGRAGRLVTSHWRMPLALAAVLVLSVSLVTVMMREGGERLSAPPAPKTDAPASGKLPASALPPAAKREGTVPVEPAPRKLDEAPAALTPARPRAKLLPEHAADQRADKAGSRTAPAKSTEQPLPELPRAAERVPHFGSAIRERAVAPEADTLTAPLSQRAPGASADSLTGEESRAAAVGALQREAVPEDAKARPLQLTLSPLAAREVQSLKGEPPEKWLERIAQLRHGDRAAEADELLAEFKRRFPGYPLPPGEAR